MRCCQKKEARIYTEYTSIYKILLVSLAVLQVCLQLGILFSTVAFYSYLVSILIYADTAIMPFIIINFVDNVQAEYSRDSMTLVYWACNSERNKYVFITGKKTSHTFLKV